MVPCVWTAQAPVKHMRALCCNRPERVRPRRAGHRDLRLDPWVSCMLANPYHRTEVSGQQLLDYHTAGICFVV